MPTLSNGIRLEILSKIEMAYRITADLVILNGGNIPTGSTSLVLVLFNATQNINGYLYPVQGFGGAVDTGGLSYFLNDPDIYVRYQ